MKIVDHRFIASKWKDDADEVDFYVIGQICTQEYIDKIFKSFSELDWNRQKRLKNMYLALRRDAACCTCTKELLVASNMFHDVYEILRNIFIKF